MAISEWRDIVPGPFHLEDSRRIYRFAKLFMCTIIMIRAWQGILCLERQSFITCYLLFDVGALSFFYILIRSCLLPITSTLMGSRFGCGFSFILFHKHFCVKAVIITILETCFTWFQRNWKKCLFAASWMMIYLSPFNIEIWTPLFETSYHDLDCTWVDIHMIHRGK